MNHLIRCLLVAALAGGAFPLAALAGESPTERAVNARVDRQLRRTLRRLAERASASRESRGQVVAMRVKIEPLAISGTR